MSHPQPPVTETSAHPVAATPPESASYEPLDGAGQWHDEPEELPRRPRRRLLTPLPLSLLAILLIACGFIGGVLVEKGESSVGAGAGSTAGLASRFAALRAGAGGAAGTSSSSSSSTSGAAGGASAGGSGFTRPTAGTVAYLAGKDLYVTNSEGNTVKVATSPATSVTKTVKSGVRAVHPGETVTIVGATGSNGTVSAESISVGSSGGGLAGLFGRSGTSSRGSTGSSSAGSEPQLFGG